MDRFTRSPASRVAATLLVVLSLAGGGYFFLPSVATGASCAARGGPEPGQHVVRRISQFSREGVAGGRFDSQRSAAEDCQGGA